MITVSSLFTPVINYNPRIYLKPCAKILKQVVRIFFKIL